MYLCRVMGVIWVCESKNEKKRKKNELVFSFFFSVHICPPPPKQMQKNQINHTK
jgi:hypothetical protein